ncbi:hypothetical protein KFK09_024181 [Dendrobium nobile]|uniref:Reverse transcriptase zinc-binding domain-containing protein n=1 Tax=Dendrobium nobile TaxID=94219 RepID=A0A8T3AD18_DENNO|nr:hypothetical protein KFK09_024181 [Dendrobium nobile]
MWDYNKLSDVIPDIVRSTILSIHINTDSNDLILCDLSYNGRFSLKEAWHYFRETNGVNKIYSRIWHKSIPKTVSVFVWRIMHNYIPFYDNLRKRGFNITSKCQCCSHEENMHHIFISGMIAIKIWSYFDDIFKLNKFSAHITLYTLLNYWFINTKGHIRSVVPSRIL